MERIGEWSQRRTGLWTVVHRTRWQPTRDRLCRRRLHRTEPHRDRHDAGSYVLHVALTAAGGAELPPVVVDVEVTA